MPSATASSYHPTSAPTPRTESGGLERPTASTSTRAARTLPMARWRSCSAGLQRRTGPRSRPSGSVAYFAPGTGDVYLQRRCVTPVAHLPDADQAAFVAASTWKGDWRDHAPHFIAAYFGVGQYAALRGNVTPEEAATQPVVCDSEFYNPTLPPLEPAAGAAESSQEPAFDDSAAPADPGTDVESAPTETPVETPAQTPATPPAP